MKANILSTLLFVLTATLLTSAPFTRAPYVQQATPSGVTIVWRTNTPITPVIRYGLSHDKLDKSTKPDSIIHRTKTEATHSAKTLFASKDQRSAPNNTHQYESNLTNLKPKTTYYYAVYDGDKRLTPESASYRFKTHPEFGKTTDALVWIVGDSGTGGTDQKQVHQAMRNYLTKHKTNLDLYLHVGDMAYGSGTDPEFSTRFFDIYDPTLRNTVCWPAMGNHEGHTANGKTAVGPYYDAYVTPTKAESGGVPSGTEAYYSFDYGDIHFICLNSHDIDRSANAAMAQWLKADLDKTKAEWLIAFWHHPPYTKGSHDSDKELQLVEMREQILPILEAGGVDCTFTGHSHIYERTMLLDKAYGTPTISENVVLDDGDGNPAGDGAYRKSQGLNPHNGSVHVVSGHGGKLGGRAGVSPVIRTSLLEFGSCLMEIKKDTLDCIMLSKNGEIRDRFSIVKKGTVTHNPIAKPWKPKGYKAPKAAEFKGYALPKKYTALIPKQSLWHFNSNQTDQANWNAPTFDHKDWPLKKAGFGYGDNDDATPLPNMRNKYKFVRVRKSFTAPHPTNISLAVRYDDGFIAYINGKEFARVGIESGTGKNARGFTLNEAKKQFATFPIDPKLIKKGQNIIAIEGHNANISSSDFTLDPYLIQSTK